jgi:RsiW-degrading membrane proteinase PrsW (M82 family)
MSTTFGEVPHDFGTEVPHKRHGWWWKVLLSGLAMWILVIIVTATTLNTNLVPTLILLGSFLVPLTVVMFAVERVTGNLVPITLILAFFVGGIFGVLGASVLEANLQQSALEYLGVGAIEEFVKGVIFVIVGWRIVPKTGYQGALLGAVVGAGFAAFESAGYAFNAALTIHGIDLASLLQTEVLRAVLTPFGHVLWTATLGSAIFAAASKRNTYRFHWSIIGAYAAVVLLHATWDSMGWISSTLALIFTGNGVQQLEHGYILRSTVQAASALAPVLYIVGLLIISAIGVLFLLIWARRGRPAGRPRAVGAHTGGRAGPVTT